VIRACRTLLWMGLCLAFVSVSGMHAQDGPSDLEALFLAGRFDDVRDACRQRLQTDPDAPEALYYMGRLSPEGGPARSCFERLLAAHPSHHLADDARMALAELAFAGPYGLYRKARNRYRALVGAHANGPHTALALCRIGQTYLIQGATDSARSYFTRCLDHDPRSAAASLARFGLAQADLQAGDSNAAAARVSAPDAGVSELLRQAFLRRLSLAGRNGGVGGAAQAVARQVWIQVGAFRVPGNATSLAQRLKETGIEAEVVAAPGRGLHLVFAGPFPDRGAAREALDRIQREVDIQGRILYR